MAFQPEVFQPEQTGLRSRVKAIWSATMPYKVAASASAMGRLDQSAWQRGCMDGSAWINRRSNAFGLVCFLIGGAVGAGLLTSSSLWVRLVEGALAGAAAWLIVNVMVYGGHTAYAYKRRRDEAREYARDLEVHDRDDAQWARRREIAEDFRRETLEFARAVFEGNWKLSAADLDTQWRGNAAAVQAQLRENGAANDVTGEIDRQLAALEAAMESKEDGYGDNDIRRIAASRQATCQNVWAHVRNEPAPTAPPPPEESAGSCGPAVR
jgi:cbb3-type cytochrome oxidase subunit 3